MPAQFSQTYGPYRVIRPLGGGGMGTVLLAEDARLGRLVALKTFSGRAAATAFAREHLLREARAAARLTHPNVAAVHDILDIGGETVIVFEYVDGETLAARLSRGRVDVAEAIRIGGQIADGLAAAHAQGIVHRDLKPANVMLTADGRVKILDFGIAQSIVLDNEETSPVLPTAVGMYAGTPAYAAPEQWLGEAVGPHTDIFALGLLLFEMLGGRRPFDTASRLTLMQQLIEAPRPHVRELNPNVPPSIDALIDSALAREPAHRPTAARDMAAVLRSLERDVPVASGVPPGRRLHGWTVSTGLALLAGVVLLVISVGSPDPTSVQASTSVVGVLPFDNATGSADNDYLAAGVADSLTTSLASLDASGITVLSRAAIRDVTSREREPSRIAKELGATYLVEGSVQRAGDRVRLTVNLVRPDKSVAWAESVEGVVDGVFEMQSRLAASLGRALSARVTSAERAKLAQLPTGNTAALAAYWRGRALFDRRDALGNLSAALEAFDEAVRLDPEFAMAHAARGEALWARYLQTRNAPDATAAVDAGTTALRLDPGSASARYATALALEGTGRRDEAIEELERVLAIQPNHDEARGRLGQVLAVQGQVDAGVAELNQAIALRPGYWGHYSALGVLLFQAARYEAAAQAFLRVVELRPDSPVGHQQLGTTFQVMGDYATALEHYQKALEISPIAQVLTNIAALHHLRGDYAKAVSAAQKSLELRPNSHITRRNLGDAYTRLGRARDAQRAYRAAIEIAERELSVNARDARTMAHLAVYLAKAGRQTEADARIADARTIAPEDVQVIYRSAVVDALAGRRDRALQSLSRAIANGFSRRTVQDDEDFAVLHDSPEFKRLVTSG